MVYRTSNFLILIDTEKKNEKGKRKRKTETPKGQRERKIKQHPALTTCISF